MFDKFGEFDSFEELNRAAAAQLAEGDHEAILLIAEENGIDREDAEDFIDGCTEEFVTPLMAAIGKIKVEAEELKLEGIFEDWKEVITQCCMDDLDICLAVRKKGKRMKICMGKLLKISFDTKKQVPPEICKAAGLNTNIYMGIPNRTEVKQFVRKYYIGEEKA